MSDKTMSPADVDDATYHLQKGRALADVMMALTNHTNNASHRAPADNLNPETLRWIAVQQFDVACKALDIVGRYVEQIYAERDTR